VDGTRISLTSASSCASASELPERVSGGPELLELGLGHPLGLERTPELAQRPELVEDD